MGRFQFHTQAKERGRRIGKAYEHRPNPANYQHGVVDRRNWPSRDRNALQNGLMCSTSEALHLLSRLK